MKHIVIAEDEQTLRENLSYALEKEGYKVSSYSNGFEAWEARAQLHPSLYILDIIMPRMDGLELCRLIREENRKVPIIFLSSKDEELDRIMGFETGGDDYLGKPFSVSELTARIRVLIRRSEGTNCTGEIQKLGKLTLIPNNNTALWEDSKIALTVSEYRLLSGLADSLQAIHSRRELHKVIFPHDQFINERAIDSHIKRIRRKLQNAGAPKNILESIYGMGYRLNVFSPD